MMDVAQRQALIAQYKEGYQVVVAALTGISAAELDTPEAPGEWSPRQVIHHLADSEMTAAIRVRCLLVEDNPRINGYDQDEFARRLHYDRPIEASLNAFKAARECTAELLDRLSEADWRRVGTHSQDGPYGVEIWLGNYGVHAHDHADQIRRARATFARRG